MGRGRGQQGELACGGVSLFFGLGRSGARHKKEIHFNPKKEMATHSITLAWRIPWTEQPGRLQFLGLQRVSRTEQLHFSLSIFLTLTSL